MELTQEIGRRFAKTALGHVTREYPHKLDHVMDGDMDAQTPQALHPCFFGSFDWHSCVHGWWTLLTLRRTFPRVSEADDIAALADSTFTTEKLDAELAYLERPSSAGFERPYGWGWLLYLHLEAARHDDKDWEQKLEPLARAFAQRFKQYLTILTYPIRTGTHFNTAFALTLAWEWAQQYDAELAQQISQKANDWFSKDRAYQGWEPGGDEFLSPGLSEAMLMQKVAPNFKQWFSDFLPALEQQKPAPLFTPATVSDRTDGKIAHLDGLNLSRAWAWRTLAVDLGIEQVTENPLAIETSQRHLLAALPHVTGDYMGEHWLASFALLAMLSEK